MVAEIVRCAVVWLAFPGGRVLFFVKLRARRKEGPAGSIKEQNSPPGNANHTTAQRTISATYYSAPVIRKGQPDTANVTPIGLLTNDNNNSAIWQPRRRGRGEGA